MQQLEQKVMKKVNIIHLEINTLRRSWMKNLVKLEHPTAVFSFRWIHND